MKYLTAGLLLLLAFTVRSEEMPIVKMQTNLGMIVLELNSEKAPKSVANFLRYAQEGFYNGTIFHRVIKNFIIQGGGYTQNDEKKLPLYEPIPNESDNDLKNVRGSIAMARLSDEPESATSQFFINVRDNATLNYQAGIKPVWGYTVFGRVTEGMDVVDEIQQVETGAKELFKKYVQQVIIEKVSVENAPPLVPKTQVSQEKASVTLVKPKNQEEASLAEPKIQELVSEISTREPSEIFLLPPDAPSEPDELEPLPD